MHKFYADYMYKVQENKSILMVFSFLSYGPNYNVFHLDGKSEELHHSVVVDFDMSQRQCVPLCSHRCGHARINVVLKTFESPYNVTMSTYKRTIARFKFLPSPKTRSQFSQRKLRRE